MVKRRLEMMRWHCHAWASLVSAKHVLRDRPIIRGIEYCPSGSTGRSDGVGIGTTPNVGDDELFGSWWPFPGPVLSFDMKDPMTAPRITLIKVRTSRIKSIDHIGMMPHTFRRIHACHGFSGFAFSE